MSVLFYIIFSIISCHIDKSKFIDITKRKQHIKNPILMQKDICDFVIWIMAVEAPTETSKQIYRILNEKYPERVKSCFNNKDIGTVRMQYENEISHKNIINPLNNEIKMPNTFYDYRNSNKIINNHILNKIDDEINEKLPINSNIMKNNNSILHNPTDIVNIIPKTDVYNSLNIPYLVNQENINNKYNLINNDSIFKHNDINLNLDHNIIDPINDVVYENKNIPQVLNDRFSVNNRQNVVYENKNIPQVLNDRFSVNNRQNVVYENKNIPQVLNDQFSVNNKQNVVYENKNIPQVLNDQFPINNVVYENKNIPQVLNDQFPINNRQNVVYENQNLSQVLNDRNVVYENKNIPQVLNDRNVVYENKNLSQVLNDRFPINNVVVLKNPLKKIHDENFNKFLVNTTVVLNNPIRNINDNNINVISSDTATVSYDPINYYSVCTENIRNKLFSLSKNINRGVSTENKIIPDRIFPWCKVITNIDHRNCLKSEFSQNNKLECAKYKQIIDNTFKTPIKIEQSFVQESVNPFKVMNDIVIPQNKIGFINNLHNYVPPDKKINMNVLELGNNDEIPNKFVNNAYPNTVYTSVIVSSIYTPVIVRSTVTETSIYKIPMLKTEYKTVVSTTTISTVITQIINNIPVIKNSTLNKKMYDSEESSSYESSDIDSEIVFEIKKLLSEMNNKYDKIENDEKNQECKECKEEIEYKTIDFSILNNQDKQNKSNNNIKTIDFSILNNQDKQNKSNNNINVIKVIDLNTNANKLEATRESSKIINQDTNLTKPIKITEISNIINRNINLIKPKEISNIIDKNSDQSKPAEIIKISNAINENSDQSKPAEAIKISDTINTNMNLTKLNEGKSSDMKKEVIKFKPEKKEKEKSVIKTIPVKNKVNFVANKGFDDIENVYKIVSK